MQGRFADTFDALPAAIETLPAAFDALPGVLVTFHAPLHSLPARVPLLPAALPLDDATLLNGFVAGDAGRTRELLERLLPLMNHGLERRWPALKSMFPDIIGQCGIMLVLWRDELRQRHSFKLRVDEPLATLADRLVNQEARKVRTGRRIEAMVAQNLTQLDAPVTPSNPEALVMHDEESERLDDLIAELPVQHEQTIRAQLRTTSRFVSPFVCR